MEKPQKNLQKYIKIKFTNLGQNVKYTLNQYITVHSDDVYNKTIVGSRKQSIEYLKNTFAITASCNK